MKKLLNTLLPFCLFWMFTASKCSKDELPPETQEGKNTFGCYVNGELFVPRGAGLSSGRKCFYQFIYPSENGNVFYVGGTKNEDGGKLTTVDIGFDSLKLEEGKVYNLLEVGRGRAYGGISYSPGSLSPIEFCYTSNLYTGELLITKLDDINHIVSGTFWFTVIKNNGETVHITDGRFDMKYTR